MMSTRSFEFFSFRGAAGFLEVAELGDGSFELAREALGVHAEVGESFGVGADGGGAVESPGR